MLYWGYDEEEFQSLPLNTLPKEGHFKDKEKLIVHAGNMFAYQDPKNFWKQIKIENEKGKQNCNSFCWFCGQRDIRLFRFDRFKRKCSVNGFSSVQRNDKKNFKADMLLVCSTEPRHVPGKLFEALRTGNPIIAFGDNNEEVKKIIGDANAGMMFGYEESGKEF